MNQRSLLQDILSEVSSRKISFQMRLHLLITLVKSSEFFKFVESLRTCITASQHQPQETAVDDPTSFLANPTTDPVIPTIPDDLRSR